MNDSLFFILFLLAVASVPTAVICAVSFYRPKTAAGCLGYALALLLCASAAYVFGLAFGITFACNWYPSGNLCGLFGFMTVGPLAASFTVILISWLLRLAR